jgi:TPR repeat protein
MNRLLVTLLAACLAGSAYAGQKEAEQAMEKKDYAGAIKEWTVMANGGNAEAQFKLGVMIGAGIGVKSDENVAVGWYSKAANQNHAEAAYVMSIAYEKGQGVKKDMAASMQWLKKAAELGSPRGQNALGDCYFDGVSVDKNHSTAVYLYRKAADQGYADAQRNMGYVYSHGQGAEQNDQEAIKWYLLAANQDLAIAQGELGGIYMKLKDYKQGMPWLMKGAEGNDGNAQRQLGVAYFLGDGVAANKAEGFKWVFIAVEANRDEEASKVEGKMTSMMTKDQVAQGRDLAIQWLKDHGLAL